MASRDRDRILVPSSPDRLMAPHSTQELWVFRVGSQICTRTLQLQAEGHGDRRPGLVCTYESHSGLRVTHGISLPFEGGAVNIPILQMRKLRPRKVKQTNQDSQPLRDRAKVRSRPSDFKPSLVKVR